jgi:alpha-galactosidase
MLPVIQTQSIHIAYIGGGSMAWARTFMNDLALEPALGGVIRLYDTDKAAAENNKLIGNRISAHPQTFSRWKYETAPSLKEALTGADFVIISILPGDFERHMRSDVHLPERLGVYQSVGDTAGPGGIVRALRTIPLFIGFAEAVREYAPAAWVINYTNPMSLCLRALYHAFPKIKAFGCCHEVFGAQELLAALYTRETGEAKPNRGDIHVNVLGINHFTWFDRASYQGCDLSGVFARSADIYYEKGFPNDDSHMPDKAFTCINRVKFDLFRRYGQIPAAGDRHLAEFMPGNMYLKNSQAAESWGFYLTSVDWRIADRARKAALTERLVDGTEDINLTPSGEEGILLIKALCGLTRVVSNVNLPNKAGQIGNLPKETVVETNAVFSRDDVRPVMAGCLNEGIHGLIEPHAENQTEVLNAALHRDRAAVYRAFARDPLTAGAGCSEGDIKQLADDMIDNTLDALPKGWGK